MLSNFRSIVQRSVRSISLFSRVNKNFTINDNNDFDDKVLNSRIPVIVTFHAEWCEPCKILTPKLEELIGPLEDLNLAVVDCELNPELVHTFDVKAVPAVIAVSNGLIVDKFIGLVDANMIENLIQKLLRKDSKNQKT